MADISVSPADQLRVRAVAEQDGPTAAVRLAQELTGVSLARSKVLVDRILAGESVPSTPDDAREARSSLADRARSVRDADGATAAVRFVQREGGLGLDAAKWFVDGLS
jgi:hypothetical protein